ncbi:MULTISPECIES: membrane protein insertion efficiency factor YidD [Seleniivibrio]|uniref:membrane protein insertion efficiency factor YidD n=1 Tax=Seleniivibrio TaxID=1649493 RepID=UPI0025D7210E|nr:MULTISPECIES: membrane protein insertion efficiency factor YidD [Seleniivibrio]
MKLSALRQILDLRRPIIFLIRLYKLFISPLLGNRCRFYPSCSDYAVEALRKKGLVKGTLMAVWRILRCSPLSKGGYDPVK